MFLLFCKDRPEGLLIDGKQQAQACLQNAAAHLATQPCKARMLYRKVVFHRFL